MTTWRGFLRELERSSRRSRREYERSEREDAKRARERYKLAVREQAEQDVASYNNLVERLTSVYKKCSPSIDWQAIASSIPPERPVYSAACERRAQQKWEHYKPSWIIKLFKLEQKRKAYLFRKVSLGKLLDEKAYAEAVESYEKAYTDWKQKNDLAQKIVKGDRETFIQVLIEDSCFSELRDFGSKVNFYFTSGGTLVADIDVQSDFIIPKEIPSVLQSGKPSRKPMPKSQFYQLYQDYVCSCTLHVAREVLALLPLEKIIVNAKDQILNTSTGYMERQALISVLIPRKSLEMINLDAIDPSDAMKNFIHNMDFKKTSGFNPVQEIQAQPQKPLLRVV